jgi:hypothetical protein
MFLYEDLLDRRSVQPAPNHCGLPEDAHAANQVQQAAGVSHELMCVNRAAFVAAGGFDENLDGLRLGTDLCLRVNAPALYLPSFSAQTHRFALIDSDAEQAIRFASKWREKAAPQALVNSRCEVGQHPTGSELGTPSCAVVLLATNSLDGLPQSLEGLHKTLGVFDRLIVVDEGSSDGTSELLTIFGGRDSRMSIVVSLEDALSYPSNECLVLAHPRFEPSQGWLMRLMMHLNEPSKLVAPACNSELSCAINEVGHRLGAERAGIERDTIGRTDCILGLRETLLAQSSNLEAFCADEPFKHVVAEDVYVRSHARGEPALTHSALSA